MAGNFVSDVVRGQLDEAGAVIDMVYEISVPNYAVYRTDDGVVVHYADDPERGARQRSDLSALAPLRGEISGLVDGWRVSRRDDMIARAHSYDGEVADALKVALATDVATAKMLLQTTRDKLVADRTSWSRLFYLVVAFGTAAGIILLSAIATANWCGCNVSGHTALYEALWFAASIGTIGALFSIALKISDRSIRTDLHMRDNVVDSIIRVGIGSLAAAMLVGLLASNIITLPILKLDQIANQQGDLISAQKLMIALTGFLGGFSERLVPDLLAKLADTAARSATIGATLGAPNGPAGGPITPPTQPPAAAEGATRDKAGGQDDADCADCVANAPATAEEATADSDLPEASGGIAQS